jgi:hypothetical protein
MSSLECGRKEETESTHHLRTSFERRRIGIHEDLLLLSKGSTTYNHLREDEAKNQMRRRRKVPDPKEQLHSHLTIRK